MSAPDFWGNQEKAQEVVTELKGVKSVLKPLDELIRGSDDLGAMIEMAEEDEEFSRPKCPAMWAALEKSLDDLETKVPF